MPHSDKQHILLKPLTLKSGITLPHRIMPGPLEGVYSPLLIEAFNQLQLIDYWIVPFIRLTTSIPRNKILNKRIKYFKKLNAPLIVQIMGREPELLTDASERLWNLGIKAINLNFACPSTKVLNSNGGASMLSNTKLMIDIIRSIRKRLPKISISLKLRSGISSTSEMNYFLPQLSKEDLDFIIFHFRTANEMYKKVHHGADTLKTAVNLSNKIPLIASGDIFSVEDSLSIVEKTNCMGISPARGLIADPFLINKIKAKLTGNKLSIPKNPQITLLKKMYKIGKINPDINNKTFFIETALFFWGRNDPKFKKLLKLVNKNKFDKHEKRSMNNLL